MPKKPEFDFRLNIGESKSFKTDKNIRFKLNDFKKRRRDFDPYITVVEHMGSTALIYRCRNMQEKKLIENEMSGRKRIDMIIEMSRSDT